jgi:hypothetical protein
MDASFRAMQNPKSCCGQGKSSIHRIRTSWPIKEKAVNSEKSHGLKIGKVFPVVLAACSSATT